MDVDTRVSAGIEPVTTAPKLSARAAMLFILFGSVALWVIVWRVAVALFG